jgi:hypothetical protein
MSSFFCRKHREKQAAASNGGRARSSDSLQDEEYGDYTTFADYLPSSQDAAGGHRQEEEEDDEREELDEEDGDEEGGGLVVQQESKAGLLDQGRAALYSLSQEAAGGKLMSRPQIQLSHARYGNF